MAEGREFDMAKEFAGTDLGDKRRNKRVIRSMDTLAKHPGCSIWASSANRAEHTAIYRLLSKAPVLFTQILRFHRLAAVGRVTGETMILAVQDTTGVN